jgi:cell wall-associated NlpC family hydrolase
LTAAATAAVLTISLFFVAPAVAATGGAAIPGQEASEGPVGKAKIAKDGTAIPPVDAPRKVKQAIEAANEIEDKPYKWGGGHGSWKDKGYDCSGAISYALHGAGILDSPLDSSGFMKWGKKGEGDWITVYSDPGHAFVVIAGLRWDTSMTPGDGPGWSKEMRPTGGMAERTWRGL